MFRILRIFLAAVLALALPAQAMAASAMASCAAAPSHAQAASAHHGHQAEAPEQFAGHHHAGHGSSTAAPAADDDGQAALGACIVCAACHGWAGPAVFATGLAAARPVYQPLAMAHPPSVAASRLERPPRA